MTAAQVQDVCVGSGGGARSRRTRRVAMPASRPLTSMLPLAAWPVVEPRHGGDRRRRRHGKPTANPEVVGAHRRLVGREHRRQRRARQGDGDVARPGRRRPDGAATARVTNSRTASRAWASTAAACARSPRPSAVRRRVEDRADRRGAEPHVAGARPDRRGRPARGFAARSRLDVRQRRFAVPVALLSLAVFFQLISDGQAALIQGMRRIADLARIGVLAAVFGALVSVVLVYCLRRDGHRPVADCGVGDLARRVLVVSAQDRTRAGRPSAAQTCGRSWRAAEARVRVHGQRRADDGRRLRGPAYRREARRASRPPVSISRRGRSAGCMSASSCRRWAATSIRD